MNKIEEWVAAHPKDAGVAMIVLAVGWLIAGLSFIICAS